MLAALGAALLYWFSVKPTTPGKESAHNVTPSPLHSPAASPSSAFPAPSTTASPGVRPTAPSSPTVGDDVIIADIQARDVSNPAESLTRSERMEAVGLLQAKKVCLEISGSNGLRQSVAQHRKQRLQGDSRFNFVENGDEADLALKVSVAAAPSNHITLTARLVDANGNVVWPLTPRTAGRRYIGAADKTIAAFSRDLTGDVRRLERK